MLRRGPMPCGRERSPPCRSRAMTRRCSPPSGRPRRPRSSRPASTPSPASWYVALRRDNAMKRSWIVGVTAGLLVAVANGPGFAQNRPAGPGGAASRGADEAAIRAAAQALARAFEKGDARAVAAAWTEDGEYVNEDNQP